MSEEDEKEGGNSPPDVIAEDAEVCCQLDQEELLIRVRKMNEHLEATRIPLHDVPVSLVVQKMSRENTAVSWSRLCQEGGRPSDGEHIRRVINTTNRPSTNPNGGDLYGTLGQRRPLTWEKEHPRSRYRSYFEAPIFDGEPSESSEDEAQHPARK